MQGLTVCVDYADMLARTLHRWALALDGVTVVSTASDTDTAALCDKHANVRLIVTDEFYANGAAFDKGGAMNAALDHGALSGAVWCCVFDADIMPPRDWESDLPRLEYGNLYGAHRWQAQNETDTPEDIDALELVRLGDQQFPGYFWLFHAKDRRIKTPMFTRWRHAGGYDSDFQDQWPEGKKVRLPTRLVHLGRDGQNWWGKGNTGAMTQMYAERARRRSLEHERIT